jgi:small Trp-rich protein
MPLLWIGLLLVLLRWFEIGPFATLSWWWVLAPLGAAALWFEGLEKFFGLDRRQVDAGLAPLLPFHRVEHQFHQPENRR